MTLAELLERTRRGWGDPHRPHPTRFPKPGDAPRHPLAWPARKERCIQVYISQYWRRRKHL